MAGSRFAGHDAEQLAREHGTPLFVYDPSRLEANVARLRGALERAGVRHRLNYALKANRHPRLLATLRALGNVGLDVARRTRSRSRSSPAGVPQRFRTPART